MNQDRKLSVLVLFLVSSLFSVPSPVHAVTGLQKLSGQGIPRLTQDECKIAGELMVKKLRALSFNEVTTGCAGISEDVGEYTPTLSAWHIRKFTVEQSIGARQKDMEKCKQDLNQLKSGVAGDYVLEAECMKGTEYDLKGKSQTFYQAWLTKLVAQSEKLEQVEGDLRGTKELPGTTHDSDESTSHSPSSGKHSVGK